MSRMLISHRLFISKPILAELAFSGGIFQVFFINQPIPIGGVHFQVIALGELDVFQALLFAGTERQFPGDRAPDFGYIFHSLTAQVGCECIDQHRDLLQTLAVEQ